ARPGVCGIAGVAILGCDASLAPAPIDELADIESVLLGHGRHFLAQRLPLGILLGRNQLIDAQARCGELTVGHLFETTNACHFAPPAQGIAFSARYQLRGLAPFSTSVAERWISGLLGPERLARCRWRMPAHVFDAVNFPTRDRVCAHDHKAAASTAGR